MSQPERVLITGASGFIGACLTRTLLAQGHEVHLILRAQAKPWRLLNLPGPVVRHTADIADLAAVKSVVKASKPEVIYHLATHGAYPAETDAEAIFATNLHGTANLLTALRDIDYKAFVHSGTSSEYGHKNGPMRVEDRIEPRTDYAITKAAATHLCYAEAKRGRPVSTVRVFSAYGPYEEPGRLVQYVMDCCARGVDPQVSSGAQPRDFIHTDDLIALMMLVAASPRTAGEVLNGGTGVQHSVKEMVDTIVAVCGGGKVKASFGSIAPRPDEPKAWVADISRTTELTGWKPSLDLRAGAQRTWDWFRSQDIPAYPPQKTRGRA